LGAASDRLRPYIAEHHTRIEFLEMVWFESDRAGLPVHLVLAYIHEASEFRKFAIDSNGARGYMQILPSVSQLIGDGDARRLFHAQTNLRFGCVLMAHELQRSNGDISKALGSVAKKYSGKSDPEGFANQVIARSEHWDFSDRN
jgi:soluble lytic murein transglycosylase-like protein